MRADAGPLVRGICDQLDIIPLINGMVPWDPLRCKLSPGELFVALIICCFLRQRPLYRVFLAFEETECELLVGRGVVPDDLNDDALGRALDKFAAGQPAKIFAAICARGAVRLPARRSYADPARPPPDRSIGGGGGTPSLHLACG